MVRISVSSFPANKFALILQLLRTIKSWKKGRNRCVHHMGYDITSALELESIKITKL